MSALPPKNLADLPPEIRDYSNGPVLLAQTASIFAIAALVVSGRCYTRGFVIKSFGKDDWAMLAAMVGKSLNVLKFHFGSTPDRHSQLYAL
jgi:hypothetical protein